MVVEAGIQPIDDSFNLAIFHRMPINIIDMTAVISLVFDQMRPESALPNTTLTPFCRLFEILSLRSISRENRPPIPANPIIAILRRQYPFSMQMICHHHDRVNLKWLPFYFYIERRLVNHQSCQPTINDCSFVRQS
jgi:hypothetical protein